MKKAYLIIVLAAIVAITGCECMKTSAPIEPVFVPSPAEEAVAAPPALVPVTPAPAPTKWNCPSSLSPDKACVIYPVSCDGCGLVRIAKVMPANVQVGQSFDYKIFARNISSTALSDVVVTEELPSNFEFKSATPSAMPEAGVLTWVIGSLDAGVGKEMIVSGMAKGSGEIMTCATATYKQPACAKTVAILAEISLTKSAPAQVSFCDTISLRYVITNKGTGTATNVVISDALPEGLVIDNGEKTVLIKAGNIAAGQSQTFTVMTKAQTVGSFTSKAMARADGNISIESATTTTDVARPVLTITKTGSESQYIGRNVTFDIKVANTGNADAENTVIEDMVPAGVKFVSATEGGALRAGKVTWEVGTLAPNASTAVSVTYAPTSGGTIANKAIAKAACADAVTAAAETAVKGISAILLEVIDISDPILVGQNETYEIVVTNQGSAADTNILITCTLEEAMTFVSAGGATQGTYDAASNKVTFAPLPSLAAKAQAKWTVTVEAGKAADVRFKTTMKSDQLTRDVEETEATTFYQ